MKLLRDLARDKGWNDQTPMSWEFGTASRSGVAHPAYAALEEPAREIERRLWSAQASALLPWIERQRYDVIERNLYEIRGLIMGNDRYEDQTDPFGLEVGELCMLFGMRGASRDVRKTLQTLRRARNALAHLSPMAAEEVLGLISSGFR